MIKNEQTNQAYICYEIGCIRKQVEIKIDIFDLLSDLKVLINEYYFAKFESSEQSLVIGFDNGQRFRLSLEEIHS